MAEQLVIPGTEPDRPAKVRAAPPRVIVADPPWGFADKLPGSGRGAEKYYNTIRDPLQIGLAIRKMVRESLGSWHHPKEGMPAISASDATLLMWRVASMQKEALAVVDDLGFVVKAELVWRKMTASGKPWFGMGRITRGAHEVCLIAARGKGAEVRSRSVRSVFDAPVGRHSEKPERFYAIVEELFAGPYVELFARRRRPGWLCLGDELPEEPIAPSAPILDR